ncbi:hypothetical protein [Tardiphaga robiniae]|uniref:hypothetical protein n=1 Tax=Tardiphaga robiniae TaxID=943830 RepID=UPI00130117FE|nr:hypothetical protein [Tardiphaga robiniae]
MRSRPGFRSSQRSQRHINSGEDHGQGSDDRNDVTRAHDGFRVKLLCAECRSHLVAF